MKKVTDFLKIPLKQWKYVSCFVSEFGIDLLVTCRITYLMIAKKLASLYILPNILLLLIWFRGKFSRVNSVEFQTYISKLNGAPNIIFSQVTYRSKDALLSQEIQNVHFYFVRIIRIRIFSDPSILPGIQF